MKRVKLLRQRSSNKRKYHLLHSSAVKAAKLWQFAPMPNNSKDRVIQLVFIFRIVLNTEEIIVAFLPPYQIEIAEMIEVIDTQYAH